MRILYLCHRLPYPPNKGDKIRAFHQIRAMAEKHEVDLFTLVDDPKDLSYRAELARHCRSVTVARVHPGSARLRALFLLPTGTPLTMPYFHSAALEAEVRNAVAKRSYDRIFVYCSAMAQYVEAAHTETIPMIMDLVDVDSDKWMQYATFTKFPLSIIYRREGRTLREFERRICKRSACVLVSTDREARLAREFAPAGKVKVLSNGVDTEYFKPAPQPAAAPAVIFTGDMSYFPNEQAAVYFAREVLPRIRQEINDATFLIVGRNPGRKMHELAKVDGIVVTGFVPDVRVWLRQARVAVAPFTIAAGIQNKIIEAMASELPVVSTSRAAQGLSAGVAKLVDVGNTVEEIAAQVVRLLRDPGLCCRKGKEARRAVMQDYSWEREAERLLSLLEDPAAWEVPTLSANASLP